jgi:hypothetical protein
MNVTSFLFVTLCSSTFQLDYSLDSSRACACSAAGFSNQNVDRAWGCTTEVQLAVLRFMCAKRLHAKIFIKKCFLFTVRSFCRIKGSRNSLNNVRNLQMIPDQVALLRLQKNQMCSGWKVDSRWQEDSGRQCSNCTRVFSWFSIQHNAWSFEFLESVLTVGAQRTEGWKNELNGSVLATFLTVCRWRRRYA